MENYQHHDKSIIIVYDYYYDDNGNQIGFSSGFGKSEDQMIISTPLIESIQQTLQ